MIDLRRRVLLFTFLALAFPLLADAQTTLSGRVIDAATGAPVVGGIVKAVNAGDEVGGGTLTNDAGGFMLIASPGFDLRALVVERIGYATQRFPADAFDPTEAVELRVESSAIELGEIVVTARSECRVRGGSPGLLQAVWDEARKSLEATALSRGSRLLRYEIESYERDLRPADYVVLRGTAQRQRIGSDMPYRSISIEQMTRRGWVEGDPNRGMQLYGPDAAVLLADEFADQHCYTVERTADAVLLHFAPSPDRRGVPEIEGTLVLDPTTSELTELRYRYVGVPAIRSGGHAGGEIYFFAAPNGQRVVREWAIRGPVMTRVRRGVGTLARDELAVGYVHEDGGRILSIDTGAGPVDLGALPLDLGAAAGGRVVGGPDATLEALTRPMAGSAGAELVVRNEGDRPFHVTSVELRDCVNTAVACGSYEVDFTVSPGRSAVVFRLRKDRVFDPFRFDWSYDGDLLELPPAEAEDADPEPVITATTAPASDERFRSSRVVTALQIPEGRYRSALEVVRTMRPGWLTTRGIASLMVKQDNVRVYLDDINLTPDASSSHLNALRSVPAELIDTIEWVDGPTATMRWGTNHQHGAIVVTTRTGVRERR